jgi:hypothetical protein
MYTPFVTQSGAGGWILINPLIGFTDNPTALPTKPLPKVTP